jgi:hypothetical protein
MSQNLELYREAKPLVSLSQLTNAADANGLAVDCIGAEEALLSVRVPGFGGTIPTLEIHWEESADGLTWADITGAVHHQIIVSPERVVAAADMGDKTYTLAAQPTHPSRLVTLCVDANDSTTAHKVTIKGTGWKSINDYLATAYPTPDNSYQANCDAVALTYIFDLATMFKASRAIPSYVWKTVTSVVGSASAGNAGGDTFQLGVDNAYQMVHQGYLDLRQRERYIRAVSVKGGSGQLGAFTAEVMLSRFGNLGVPVNQAFPVEFTL